MTDAPFESDAAEVVRVRTAAQKGKRWYYAVNTEAKPASVSFPVVGTVVDTVGGAKSTGQVKIDLAPYELRSFVSSGF